MGCLAALLLGIALGLAIWADPDASHARSRASVRPRVGNSAAGCPGAAAAARSAAALAAAEARFRLEAEGATIHSDLRRIARDGVLVQALSGHELARALAEADRQLVRHVVRIRVLSGPRVLVDANPTSFDVGGSGLALRGPGGRSVGRLQITVQDIIGFDKLVHKLIHADVVVRGAAGRRRTTLPAAARLPLPRSGCVRVGARAYDVGFFRRRGFTGEALRIWVLTPA